MYCTGGVGIPVGIISTVKQYSLLDNLTLTGALILSSMPGFWLGTFLILLFALKLSWLPAVGTIASTTGLGRNKQKWETGTDSVSVSRFFVSYVDQKS